MKMMFVVAHPDDEVLGCGGLINKSIANGHDVEVVIMNADFEKTRKEMFEDIEKSHKVLGIENRCLFSYKNMDFIREPQRDMVESIEEEIRTFKPDYIFTHFDKDIHNDHRVTSVVCQQASRLWQRHSEGHKIHGLFMFEVLSSTNWSNDGFKPDTYVEISQQDLNQKVKALLEYKNVVRPCPHPRSAKAISSLAVLRGCDVGYNYAEAFKTVWRDCL